MTEQSIKAKLIVCIEQDDKEVFVEIPLKKDVRIALKDVLETTQANIAKVGKIPKYEPAEKYSSFEILYCPKDSIAYEKINYIYSQQHFVNDCQVLKHAQDIIYYMGIFENNKGEKIIGVKRANSFKGLIKSKGRLLAAVDDSLNILDMNVFKLDNDFDFIIEKDQVLICRPMSFEFCAQMDEQLLKDAKQHTKELENKISFISCDSLSEYVSKHTRAARLIASIRNRDDLDKISKKKLKDYCSDLGVVLKSSNGKFEPEEGHQMDFLYILDRRKYGYELIENEPEVYLANSRKQI